MKFGSGAGKEPLTRWMWELLASAPSLPVVRGRESEGR
jgi:hypothetical protein